MTKYIIVRSEDGKDVELQAGNLVLFWTNKKHADNVCDLMNKQKVDAEANYHVEIF